MSNLIIDDQFRSYLLSTYQVDSSQLNQILDELGAYFSLSVKEFVPKRHRELQQKGLQNKEIYLQIQRELEERTFKADSLSVRQIRRLIYG